MSSNSEPDGQAELWKEGQPHPYLPEYRIQTAPHTVTDKNGNTFTLINLVRKTHRGRFWTKVELPNWPEMLDKPLWTLREAACLMFAVNPHGVYAPTPAVDGVHGKIEPHRFDSQGRLRPGVLMAIDVLEHLARDAIDAGELTAFPQQATTLQGADVVNVPVRVRRIDFVAWAARKGYTVPRELLMSNNRDGAPLLLDFEGFFPGSLEELEVGLLAFGERQKAVRYGHGKWTFRILEKGPNVPPFCRVWMIGHASHDKNAVVGNRDVDPDFAGWPYGEIAGRNSSRGTRVTAWWYDKYAAEVEAFFADLLAYLAPEGLRGIHERPAREADAPGAGEPPAGQGGEGAGQRGGSLVELELPPDARKVLTALYQEGGPQRYGAMMNAAGINKSELARALKHLRELNPQLVYRVTNDKGSRGGFSLTRDGERVARELCERVPDGEK